ncbi:thiamine phosphate synthase [Halarcobacter ebronensis]|uniref:thiamine phosphate synthase n=1 Tax=Halarcobacter ebronensis TaxID=1462615 RepID=UPI001E4510B7|nr:thiamine phosphate synthase [Halarcobacter ebronensis]
MDDNLISYLITDPTYYTSNEELFKKNLQEVLTNKRVDMACFRDKESANCNELAKIFVETCKEFNVDKILLNENIVLASQLEADGVHLTSNQFDKIKEAKNLDLYTIISCHDYKELDNAQKLHVNAVTYSPIFITPNKGEPKGVSRLKEVVRLYEDLDIIALGGVVSEAQIKEISKSGAYGFASIRYFVN